MNNIEIVIIQPNKGITITLVSYKKIGVLFTHALWTYNATRNLHDSTARRIVIITTLETNDTRSTKRNHRTVWAAEHFHTLTIISTRSQESSPQKLQQKISSNMRAFTRVCWLESWTALKKFKTCRRGRMLEFWRNCFSYHLAVPHMSFVVFSTPTLTNLLCLCHIVLYVVLAKIIWKIYVFLMLHARFKDSSFR